jgi:hypothetical protein
MGGERITITLDVAELVPGTYVYLDADDEIIMRGAILDAEDAERGVPLARTDFGGEFDDEEDTDPDGRTIVGPLLAPRAPAPVPAPSRTATTKGSPIRPRPPVPTPDQIPNEIDDDDIGGHTTMGPLIKPRRPAPAKGKR